MNKKPSKKNLSILMAAAECRGVAKVGGLGDVVFDLSRELVAAGHQVVVVLPLYGDHPLPASARSEAILDFLVRFEGQPVATRLHRAVVGGLTVHLVESAFFQGTEGGVYVDSGKRGKGPFEDDARRFAFFSAAVWELVKHHEPFSSVQVLHCHDWHTALVPLLASLDGEADRFSTVFTIHNLDYQGTRPFDEPYAPGASWRQWFPERWDALVGSPWKDAVADPGASHCFNPLRCGIRLADAVNTVSPSYALEITQPDDLTANFLGGRGLEDDLARRQQEGRLWGILNGLDYVAYDPTHLDPPYSAESSPILSVRQVHQGRLRDELPGLLESLVARLGPRFGNSHRALSHLPTFLKASEGLPLTVCVTRAVSQKLGLFTEEIEPGVSVARAFLAQGTALLLLGTGELEDKLEPLNDEPTALFLQVFDAEVAQRLYAAGDLFLMPSDFEPCGISQLMALRYGCLPLVHDRGGLHDTIFHGQTGFVFRGNTRQAAKRAFVEVARQAVELLNDPVRTESMVRQAMAQRFTWDRAVDLYLELYRKIL